MTHCSTYLTGCLLALDSCFPLDSGTSAFRLYHAALLLQRSRHCSPLSCHVLFVSGQNTDKARLAGYPNSFKTEQYPTQGRAETGTQKLFLLKSTDSSLGSTGQLRARWKSGIPAFILCLSYSLSTATSTEPAVTLDSWKDKPRRADNYPGRGGCTLGQKQSVALKYDREEAFPRAPYRIRTEAIKETAYIRISSCPSLNFSSI